MQRAIDASYQAACSYAKNGETEAALEALQGCLDAGERDLERWQLDPDLDPLRRDARFQRLLGELAAVAHDRVSARC